MNVLDRAISVFSPGWALKRAAAQAKSAPTGAAAEAALKDADARGGAPVGGSLATIPQLSRRALLVLELRRLYEAIHMGGFERVCPPPSPALADRYRRIAEYVPPALRETFAFAKRRLEALAMRAGIEAKKNSGFRM
jgi:hypothetical protein